MDHTKFLTKTEAFVLPYLGGPYVFADGRRLRVEDPRPAIGWTRFEVRGRSARAGGPAEAPPFGKLPRIRGHHVAGFVVADGGERLERVRLFPSDEEPPAFAIVRARRWHSGDVVFEAFDFDGEVEDTLRLCLEKSEAIPKSLSGVAASARVAHGIALVLRAARALSLEIGDVAVRSAFGPAAVVAAGGIEIAREWLHARTEARVGASGALDNAHRRAEIALHAAHAQLLSSRRLEGDSLEVAFEFMGERIVSVVDAITLHVFDSGVCLAGADELLTLDSLPGVIREAIEGELLVITRH